MTYNQKTEQAYQDISKRGVTGKQSVDQHELIRMIMKHGYKKDGKIWWFAYELMGHWNINPHNPHITGENYFMSYKASTRVCELAKDGEVETRPTEGKLCVYALKKVLEHLQIIN